ncbi:MAG: ABC transporter ATP-binding protein [Acidimicrobiales bacterium]
MVPPPSPGLSEVGLEAGGDPALLAVRSLSKSYAGVRAVADLSFDLSHGQIMGVLGPNGAGKSTLFKTIAGYVHQNHGSIFLAGHRLDRLAPHVRAGLGIRLVFQQPKLFEGMSVYENLLSGLFLRGRSGFVAAMLRLPGHFRDERTGREAAHLALERFGLTSVADSTATSLPFGLQRRVAVARSAIAGDRLLMLDEPAAGLTGGERDDLRELLAGLPGLGMTLMVIEHDVRFVAALAQSLLVMDMGAVIADGEPARVLRDPRVVAAYSGIDVTC